MTASYKSYIIKDENGKMIDGPYATRARCRRVIARKSYQNATIEAVANTVDTEVASNDAKVEKKKKKVVIADEKDYTYRSGYFSTEEAVKELIEKLGVTTYVVQFDSKKGFYGLYNDPE